MSEPQSRSIFVTVVAWIFIVISGFATLISALQNVMIHTLMRPEIINAAESAPPPGLPPAAAFMSSHFHYVFAAFFLASFATLVVSIGLLRRWNWCRICFIGMMLLGVLWNVCVVAFQAYMMYSISHDVIAANASAGTNMQSFMVATVAVAAVFAIGMSSLFGWIAWRLHSPTVAIEFKA